MQRRKKKKKIVKEAKMYFLLAVTILYSPNRATNIILSLHSPHFLWVFKIQYFFRQVGCCCCVWFNCVFVWLWLSLNKLANLLLSLFLFTFRDRQQVPRKLRKLKMQNFDPNCLCLVECTLMNKTNWKD